MASLISMQDLSENDIIIDIIKSYALRRIGVYSSDTVLEVIHTFVPIDSLCVASPNTDICLYASLPIKTNVVELATMMTSRQMDHTLSSYDSESVSKLINKDMNQFLMQHRPDEIMKEAQSTIHFVDKQFHYKKNEENKLTRVSSTNVIDHYSDIPHLYPTSLEVIRNQINNKKISFDYLSEADLKFFLSTIFSKLDNTYTIANVKESSNIFLQSVIGQSIFALRYCSLNPQNSLSSRPCLAISTLFLRIPADTTTKFLIYHLIPLPVVSNGNKYIYSNLPKVIGINPIDQTLITWYDETDIKHCTFSSIVQCEKMLISMPLSKSLCLSELFDDNQLYTNICDISRSQHMDGDIINIDNGIWLFHNVRQTEYCHTYSASKELSETLPISEAAIVRVSCNKTIACGDIQLPPSSCKQQRAIVKSNVASKFRHLPSFIVPIRNMTDTLITSYQRQSQKSIKELSTVFASKQFMTTYEMLLYAIAALLTIVAAIVSYISKYIIYNVHKPIQSYKNVMDV